MSLSAVMTALVEFVGDVLVNEGGRPVPDRTLRYFGSAGLPQDCCTEDGVLSVAWDRGWPTERFPIESATTGSAPCPGRPAWLLAVRYDVCWTAPDVDAEGITLDDETWDTDAAMLADSAEIVARALARLGCGGDTRPKAVALLATVREEGLRFRDVTPTGPAGSCARVTWRVYADPRSTGGPS